jgi:NAD(P)-dependent dehydrogenase (short-subunit alcohol dehydrogenase family)
MTRASYVVTGGSQGVGRAIAERLAADGHVVVVDVTESSGWDHPSAEFVTGDARTADVVQQAAARAEAVAPLIGWVNNAAIFATQR